MKKIILMILDGFGINNDETGNAIKTAKLPNLNNILSAYPVAELDASAESVGLLKGQAGNCEAGHMAIGTGRVVKQPIVIIDDKIKDKSFFENDTLLDLMDFINENNRTLHLIGAISNSNVHSSIDHLYAVIALAKIRKIKKVVFHFITDGVESDPYSAKSIIETFMNKISKLELGTIGTVCGRYYAMDASNNYDRIKKAYDSMVYGIANNFNDINKCMELHYKNKINDEFINPSIIDKSSVIRENDGVLFFNFTKDSNSELINSFVDEKFNAFNTKKFKNVRFVSLFDVHDKVESAFTTEPITNSFGEYLCGLQFRQARISEYEKYPFISYYFDGGEIISDNTIDKFVIPSIKEPRYDMKPELNIGEISKKILDCMEEDYDFILVNMANPDLLSKTGNLPSLIHSLEAMDFCIGKIIEKAKDNFYDVVITSDHGSAEYIKDKDGKDVFNRTTNKVPFVIVNSDYKLNSSGTLADVIPTIIDMFEISKPDEMSGESLIVK